MLFPIVALMAGMLFPANVPLTNVDLYTLETQGEIEWSSCTQTPSKDHKEVTVSEFERYVKHKPVFMTNNQKMTYFDILKYADVNGNVCRLTLFGS